MKKKIVSITLATAMMFSMLAQVNAADPIEGSGDTTYVDKGTVNVTVPTTVSGSLFSLDPQGLLGATNSGALDTTKLTANEGKIIGNQILNIKNAGPVAAKVSVTFTPKKTGDKTKFLAASTNVNSGTDNNVYFEVVPNDTMVDSGKTIAAAAGDTSVAFSAGTAIGVAEGGTKVDFVLSANEYEFTLNNGTYAYSPKDSGKVYSQAFKIGGSVNKNADWKSYTESSATDSVKMQMVFDVSAASADDVSALSTKTNGVISSAAATVAPTFGTSNAITFKRDAAAVINYTVGSGADALTGIKTVNITYSNGTAWDGIITNGTSADETYCVLDTTAHTITFPVAMSSLLDEGDITIVYTTSDGDKTVKVTATLSDD